MKKLAIIAIILGLIAVYFFTFNLRATKIEPHAVRMYDPEGFIDAETLDDPEKLVAQNSNFKLYIDENTSYIKVVDLRTNAVYYSNPTDPDPWEEDVTKSITTAAKERQKATIDLTYYNKAGSSNTINNYRLSIYHPDTVLRPEGERTFGIKYIPNGVQVKYVIEDTEIDQLYFPKFLPKDVIEAMNDFNILSRLAYTGYDSERELYEITNYENMSKITKQRLYNIFYRDAAEDEKYTRERAIEENEHYGYFEQHEKVRFEVAVELELTEKGLRATILKDSIVESEDIKIARLTLYPFFGTAVSEVGGVPTSGYLVVPDGSGAIIEFNNEKYYASAYNKRLYGQDLAQLPYKMAEQQQPINMPVYGMVKDDGGFAAIITEGDAMAAIFADVSGRNDSYNKIYPTFNVREVEAVVIGTGWNTYGVDLWTKTIVLTDFTVEYHFLKVEENNYVGIAKKFQEYLMEEKGFTAKPQSDQTIATIEFLGAYDYKSFFLGVPYYTNKSMTTYDQAKIIIDGLQDRGVTEMNVLYQGAINGGLSQDINDRVKFERSVGNKRNFERFETYLESLGVDVYQSINLMTAKGYHKLFDQYRYTASRIRGNHAEMYDYHYPTRLPYSETNFEHSKSAYVINPVYYEAIFKKLNRGYDFNNIEFSLMGSRLTGHYDRNVIIYKQDSLRMQEAFLETLNKAMMLNNPSYYAFNYANYMTDIPLEATLYSIIDAQIPLQQLVLSGMVEYSGHSINLASDRGFNYEFLKHIETGSNLKYTLTYEDSRALLNTEYNEYMATHYVNWLDMIEEQVKTLDALGIHEGYLVNHEIVSHNVYRVTYSNGIKILINYNLNPRNVSIYTIPGMSYLVEGV